MTTNNVEYQLNYMKHYAVDNNFGFYSTKISNMKRSFKANNKNINSSRLTLTTNEFLEILEYFQYSCCYCGKQTLKLVPSLIIRFSHGGNLEKSNVLPSCSYCNNQKLHRTKLEYDNFYTWYKQSSQFDIERYNKIIQYINNTSQKYNNEFENYLIE